MLVLGKFFDKLSTLNLPRVELRKIHWDNRSGYLRSISRVRAVAHGETSIEYIRVFSPEFAGEGIDVSMLSPYDANFTSTSSRYSFSRIQKVTLKRRLSGGTKIVLDVGRDSE